MTTELWDLATAADDLSEYLGNATVEDASRDEIMELVHQINAAYINYTDSVDKAALKDVL